MGRVIEIGATAAAAAARRILSDDPRALDDAWRFGIKQLVDDYTSTKRLRGLEAATALFAPAPPPSGDARFDAALAGLAEHLARHDGWVPPAWAFEEDRYAETWWFVWDLESLRATALVQSPLAFRKRGVFICDGDLTRV